MDNQLTIPEVNPVYFYKKGRVIAEPQYNTKFREEFFEREGRPSWQQSAVGEYFQKWQNNDIIRLQFMSNVAPITLSVYNCAGIIVGTPLLFTQKQRNRYIPDLFVYEASLALTGIIRGRYRLEVTIGDPVIETLESDWIDIATTWDNTVLIEYSSALYYGDGIFATGWAPTFRVEGWFNPKPPASKDSLYEDQVLNQRILLSDPYYVEEFIIGPGSGVPVWTPEKMIWLLGCEELYIDGKAFTKADGAKFSEETLDNYPFRGYKIDLRPTNRRSSRIFPLDPSVGGKKILVALNVETEGFADTDLGASSNVIQITEVE